MRFVSVFVVEPFHRSVKHKIRSYKSIFLYKEYAYISFNKIVYSISSSLLLIYSSAEGVAIVLIRSDKLLLSFHLK